MKKCSLGLFLLSLFLVSCSKIVYLDNMVPEQPYAAQSTELRIRKGDKLSIVVNSKNPEVAAPFNIHSGIFYQVSGIGEVSAGKSVNTSTVQGGYVVDNSGMIDFPILGRLRAAKLTSIELANKIKERLIINELIDDPVVNVEFLETKITVMGEVKTNRTISLNSSGLNLLEAISLSGGLTGNAAPQNVTVIREEQDICKMYETDIRSTELFQSPCFALQQNDIVYIRPRSAQSTVKEERGWRIFSVGTGLASLVVSLLVLLK